MARAIARRHPNRARTWRILFSDRNLHYHQHRFELVDVDLSTLSESRSTSAMISSTQQRALDRHVLKLRRCRRCPRMKSTPVSGGAIISDVMIIGQAPGPREPTLKRPFAHTAGRTLFRWFEQFCGISESKLRSKVYFAAVCRCFPGKAPGGTDRVPVPDEIQNCARWIDEEMEILRPRLVIPVGRLAIMQLIDCEKLDRVIGRKFRGRRAKQIFDLIPLPHPSGASPWHKIPPGKQLLEKAMRKIARHPAIVALR
jgi:uracil-DNA glycosylase